MICVRCDEPITDLSIDDGGVRHWVYCPKDHYAWLREFKIYQAEFVALIAKVFA